MFVASIAGCNAGWIAFGVELLPSGVASVLPKRAKRLQIPESGSNSIRLRPLCFAA
jgi:hypothetical protein